MQLSTQTTNKKIPTLYIGDRFYKILGVDLKTLRSASRMRLRCLSKALNISEYTLRSLEKGEINKPYEYVHIYCRHFSVDPNEFIKKYNLECNTLNEKIEYLKLYYGVKNLRKLDAILNIYAGGVSDYITRNRNKIVKELIINKYEEIKKEK